MSIFGMAFREIVRRRFSFFLALLAVVVASGSLAAASALLRAHRLKTMDILAAKEVEVKEAMAQMEDDYRVITKDMGFNILILPKDVNLTEFYTESYADKYMPEGYVQKLANSKIVTVQHLMPSLQKKFYWPEKQRTILLMGVRDEIPQPNLGPTKKPLEQPVKEGHVILGHEIHNSLGYKEGDSLDLAGRTYTIQTTHPERGTVDDITMWAPLTDVQEIVEKPGLINGILALECNCAWGDVLAVRDEIGKILPDTYVIEKRTQAIARAEARLRAAEEAKASLEREKEHRGNITAQLERLTSVLVPLVVLVAAAWVGLLAWLNVRERREEIGILRAIGVRASQIQMLFLVRCALVGAVGAFLGYLLGVFGGIQFGARILEKAPETSQILFLFNPVLWGLTILLAPVAAMIAGWIPAQVAAQQDPAEVLRGE
jgi:hypothetical protein